MGEVHKARGTQARGATERQSPAWRPVGHHEWAAGGLVPPMLGRPRCTRASAPGAGAQAMRPCDDVQHISTYHAVTARILYNPLGEENMRRRTSFCPLVCAWMCLLLLRAQVETTTSITGIVTDSSGTAVLAATLTLKNQQTGAAREPAARIRFLPFCPVSTITASHPGKAVVVVHGSNFEGGLLCRCMVSPAGSF